MNVNPIPPDLFALVKEGRRVTFLASASKARLAEQRREVAGRASEKAQQASVRQEWQPTSSVVFVLNYHCLCCRKTFPVLTGFGLEMKRSCDESTRTVTTPQLKSDLPVKLRYSGQTTPACLSCSPYPVTLKEPLHGT